MALEHGRKPVKPSQEINKNFTNLSKYSHQYMNKTFNDYDNQVKQGNSQLYEKLGLKAKNRASGAD